MIFYVPILTDIYTVFTENENLDRARVAHTSSQVRVISSNNDSLRELSS